MLTNPHTPLLVCVSLISTLHTDKKYYKLVNNDIFSEHQIHYCLNNGIHL